MPPITLQQVTLAGLTPSGTPASAGGDTYPNAPAAFLYVENSGAIEVTVSVGNSSCVVPAGSATFLFPRPTRMPVPTASLNIAYSSVSGVHVAALTLRPLD